MNCCIQFKNVVDVVVCVGVDVGVGVNVVVGVDTDCDVGVDVVVGVIDGGGDLHVDVDVYP